MVRPLGVMLAGGSSRRMGTDKALIEIAGRHLAEIVAAALDAATEGIVVAGRPDGWLGLPGLPDLSSERKGPLAGLLAAASAHPDRSLLVVGVDQPWVRVETLASLARLTDDLPVVPVDGGSRQTLCAGYPPGLLEQIRAEYEAAGSIQSLLDLVSFEPIVESTWQGWGEDGRSWYSVDTPESLDIGLARYGSP